MATPLEKARKDPDSMKAKILDSAKKIFSEYGYHGATTRMIAKDVGIDISTLYYHWGEKKDLYESVILDLDHKMKFLLIKIEKKVAGKPLAERLEIGIDLICDYLFENPEICNLVLSRYFSKIRFGEVLDFKVPEYITNIIISFGLAPDKHNIPVESKARIVAVCNSIFTFIAGKNFLTPMFDMELDDYYQLVKETLKFILIPAFTQS